MRVHRIENGKAVPVYDIMEATYSGKDMGDRSVQAKIKFADTIDFQLQDFVEIHMQTLLKGNGLEGGVSSERFYLYTIPTVKKNARKMSSGDAFETTVVFHPRQYELGTVLMRDILQQDANADTIIYTGFDNVTFYGGAAELMQRIQAVLDERFGKGVWNYVLNDALNENVNTTLERFAFSFSGNTVQEALNKIADKEGINSTYFVNDRTIYVGFKRPYFCGVNSNGAITTTPLNLTYGKTSHLPIDLDHGGLFSITKAMGNESPITRLYAYGANRNLNRYYCSDRIHSGRFVNQLMLPMFDADGRTDYIESPDGVQRYGVREASKQFDEIYPSLRYMTYGDLRQIKYCIKVKASGLRSDTATNKGFLEKTNANAYPIARVQCYKVVEDANGLNHLEECAPDHDIAVSVHASGKVVRTVLYGGASNADAIAKQKAHDFKVPVREQVYGDGSIKKDASGNVLYEDIPGACFLVHDPAFDPVGTQYRLPRERWFDKPDWDNSNIDRTVDTTSPDVVLTPEQQQHRDEILDKNEIIMHQIEYVDTFWLTDLYKIDVNVKEDGKYSQTFFPRDGYSAWCWARTNAASEIPDEIPVNEVIAVEEIVREDTILAITDGTIQKTFDVYLRDVGFTFDEQNDFGEMVFVFDDVKMSFLDGMLAGREYPFIVPNETNWNAICAYKEDGTLNNDFFIGSDYTDGTIAQEAFDKGAFWRVTCRRAEMDEKGLGIILPMKGLNAKAGDHIVFLDLYMPDIYIHAAENRLLREARKYLNANDRGKITYSVDFDKVRILQIPNYPLQIREGLNMRMMDADLNITTEDDPISIYSNENGLSASKQIKSDVQFEVKETGEQYTRPSMSETYVTFVVPVSDTEYERLHLDNPVILQNISTMEITHPMVISKTKTTGWDGVTVKDVEFNVRLNQFTAVGEVQNICLNLAPTVYDKKDCFVKMLPLDFSADKYYTITFDASTFQYTYQKYSGNILSVDNLEHPIKLMDSSGNEFVPDCEILSDEPITDRGIGFRRVTVRFSTPESFNDDALYYVCVGFKSELYDPVLMAYLYSVTQTNTNEGGVPYVDFVADSVTIKIKDNTRPVEDRVVGVQTMPIYEVHVTLAENRNASSWSSMNNSISSVTNDVEQIAKTYESVVNLARSNYSQLLGLKGAIFDPDGNCNQTFLQVMMMQVGADSMNYRMRKTMQALDGKLTNVQIIKKSSARPYDRFVVLGDDTLDHYVYTQGAQGGTWKVSTPDPVYTNLAPVNDLWPVYYVCIKCRKDAENDPQKGDGWIVSTKQYAVNDSEDTECWFFNWGILVPDSNGNYKLTETRGNAYMYGDRLVCGKISDIANRCWFDLDKGEFVLGDTGNGSMLAYRNGKLTIANSFSTTIIDGGTTLTDLLLLKDDDGNVVSGMSGKSNEPGNGVSMWTGGTYAEALDASIHSMEDILPLLPVLITKLGIGSNIGCLKVIDKNTVCVMSNDGNKRIIMCTEMNDNVSIFLQKKDESGLWRTITRMTTDTIAPPDNSVDTYSIPSDQSRQAPFARKAGETKVGYITVVRAAGPIVTESDIKECSVRLGIDYSKYFSCNVSVNKLIGIMISCDIFRILATHKTQMFFVSGSVAIIAHLNKTSSLVFKEANFGVSYVPSVFVDNNMPLEFEINMFDVNEQLQGGITYELVVRIDRFNYDYTVAGVDYSQQVLPSESVVKETSLSIYLKNGSDILFTEIKPFNETAIGENGILISRASDKYVFIQHSGQTADVIDVRFAGLPSSSTEAESNGLYVDNGFVKIK